MWRQPALAQHDFGDHALQRLGVAGIKPHLDREVQRLAEHGD